jgi:hypothetical protein
MVAEVAISQIIMLKLELSVKIRLLCLSLNNKIYNLDCSKLGTIFYFYILYDENVFIFFSWFFWRGKYKFITTRLVIH